MDAANALTLISRAQAVAHGWTDDEIRQGVASGDLTRIRRGGYVRGRPAVDLTPESRHLIAVRLAAAGLGTGVVSHVSAAAVWGLPLVDTDTRRVHITLSPENRSGRITRERHDHAISLHPDEIASANGIPVTSAARTVVDLARTSTTTCAVVAADAALNRGLCDAAGVRAVVTRSGGLPGINRARRVLRLIDGRSESPGETLTRLALAPLGVLDAQVDITDDAGSFVGRTDLALRAGALLIEFDGTQKYVRDRRAGQSIEDAVLAEKRREDALRALGFGVVRVVWSDLRSSATLLDRVRRAAERGAAQLARGDAPRGGYRPRPPHGI